MRTSLEPENTFSLFYNKYVNMLVRSIKNRFRDNAGKLVLNLNSYSEHELGLKTLITEPESCGPLNTSTRNTSPKNQSLNATVDTTGPH